MTAWLGGLSPRGRVIVGVVAAVIVGLLGYSIGHSAARVTYPADDSAEVGFMRDMSTHHAQAVELGMIAYQNATRQDVRTLAGDIATTQQAQIGMMRGWLTAWGRDLNSANPPMAWVPGGDEMVQGNLMPGMATREQVDELRDATGEQVDVLFVQLMLRHHLGGIHMVDELLAQNPTQPLRDLAQAMKNGQQSEVTALQDLLTQLGAEQLPN